MKGDFRTWETTQRLEHIFACRRQGFKPLTAYEHCQEQPLNTELGVAPEHCWVGFQIVLNK